MPSEQDTASDPPSIETIPTPAILSRFGRFLRGESAATVALVLLSLLPVSYVEDRSQALNDDSYITLTYAKNLAAGRGFVYNHGEPYLGTTTPLLTLIAAGLGVSMPSVDMSVSTTYFTAICLAGVAWVIFLGRRLLDLGPWEAFTVGSFVVVYADPVWLGMEAFLCALLLTAAWCLALARQWFLCGLVCGLAYMARGEGILLLPCILAALCCYQPELLTKNRRELVRTCFVLGAGAAIPILLWSGYAYATFGSVLPSTLAAKQAQVLAYGEATVGEKWPLWLRGFGIENQKDIVPAYAAWVAFVIGTVEVIKNRRRWLVLPFYVVLYIVGYSMLRVQEYPWYALPVFFVWLIGSALGIITVARWATQLPQTYRSHVRLIVFASAIGLCVHSYLWSQHGWYLDPRHDGYRRVARWLERNSSPGSSVAIGEVGCVGYYSDNRFVDLFGLITPGIASYLAKNDRVSGFWNERPDYMVWVKADTTFMRIIRNERFTSQYKLVAIVLGNESGVPDLRRPWHYVFQRDGIEPALPVLYDKWYTKHILTPLEEQANRAKRIQAPERVDEFQEWD